MKALFLAGLLAVVAPLTAQADTLQLSTPMAGETLHTDAVDMSVYWTVSDDAFVVVAYYIAHDEPSTPNRLQMHLRDGERVFFGLPGIEGANFSFERNAGTLIVNSMPVQTLQALN